MLGEQLDGRGQQAVACRRRRIGRHRGPPEGGGHDQVVSAQWGPAISKNPLLAFRVRGAKAGDTLVVAWEDNKGEKDRAEAAIA